MSETFIVRKLYYGEESSYGEAASPTDVLGLARTWNAGPEMVREDIRLGDRVYHSRLPLGLNFSPSVEFLPLTGKFLKYILGNVTDSGTEAPYTHTITVGSSLKSLTIEAARIGASGIAERAIGVLVDSAEISVETDGLLTVSLDCRAKQVEVVDPYTDPALSPPSKDPYKFKDMTFSVDGTTYAIITSARISFNNNLQEKPRSGDYISGFILAGAEYEAEVELLFEDYTFFTKMLNKATGNVELKFARAADDYILFKLNDCLFEWESEMPFEGDLLTQTVRLYPKTISVEVKDDIASY